MIHVSVIGAGRMGREVIAGLLGSDGLQLTAVYASPGSPVLGIDAGTLVGRPPYGTLITALGGQQIAGEVVIDFSLPDGLAQALPLLDGAALVSGTTGISASTQAALKTYAQRAPVLQAANFSTGVNLLLDLAARAAKALPDYDIEITEIHHHHKVDAPSGTALALGHAVAGARGVRLEEVVAHGRQGHTGARPKGQIGMHALRMGDVTGEHSLWLAGPGERVQLGHIASSRQTFAQGALRAARWIADKPPGVYHMADVLGLR